VAVGGHRDTCRWKGESMQLEGVEDTRSEKGLEGHRRRDFEGQGEHSTGGMRE
jgi:hypothetical protein